MLLLGVVVVGVVVASMVAHVRGRAFSSGCARDWVVVVLQAELHSEVSTMTLALRMLHCQREMHLSSQLSSVLEFEMQTCGSLFTGLDYILQKV